jgi:hypothetical protein
MLHHVLVSFMCASESYGHKAFVSCQVDDFDCLVLPFRVHRVLKAHLNDSGPNEPPRHCWPCVYSLTHPPSKFSPKTCRLFLWHILTHSSSSLCAVVGVGMGLFGGGGERTTPRWLWFMRDQGRECAASPWWGPGWWQAGTTGPYRWGHPTSLESSRIGCNSQDRRGGGCLRLLCE